MDIIAIMQNGYYIHMYGDIRMDIISISRENGYNIEFETRTGSVPIIAQ